MLVRVQFGLEGDMLSPPYFCKSKKFSICVDLPRNEKELFD